MGVSPIGKCGARVIIVRMEGFLYKKDITIAPRPNPNAALAIGMKEFLCECPFHYAREEIFELTWGPIHNSNNPLLTPDQAARRLYNIAFWP
jgi:hypothetical protein